MGMPESVDMVEISHRERGTNRARDADLKGASGVEEKANDHFPDATESA